MKRVKSLIKLTNLKSERLNEKEQTFVSGGGTIWCGCYYSECGGSSTEDNDEANLAISPTTVSIKPVDQAEWNDAR